MSAFTRTDQKFLSLALSSLWKLSPGLAGLSCKSNAVVFTDFCSSPVSRARLSVNVSAMRKSIPLRLQRLAKINLPADWGTLDQPFLFETCGISYEVECG